MLRFLTARLPAPAALAILVLASGAAPLGAQRASPWLPPQHWTRAAIARLHAAGLTSLDPASPHPAADVTAALPAAQRALLSRELPAAVMAPDSPQHLTAGASAGLLLVGHQDRLRPGGHSLDRQWLDPARVPDLTAAGVRLRAWASPASWLAFTAEAAFRSDGVRLEHGTADLVYGALGAWAGRRQLGFTPAGGGGLVLHQLPQFDGGGVRTAHSIRLPLAGPVSAEMFGGPLGRNGHVRRPLLLAARVHAQPHARLDFGATRAAVFGTMDGSRLTVRDYLEVLIGANLAGSRADDQVAALDARWRPPLAQPVELYGEWGLHDIDLGVLIDVPGFTAGVRLPYVPLLRGAGIAVEHTRIAGACCGNPPWYHHFELADGWTASGRLLGHPLGGHGQQWRASLIADARPTIALLEAALMRRSREAENLFAPAREGRSWAVAVSASALLGTRATADLDLFAEHGSGWNEQRVVLSLARRF